MKSKLENAKKLLVVVDLVKGFVTEGNMADPKINGIVPESKRLVKEFIENDHIFIYVKDCHEKNATEFNRFPEHCVKGTSEAEMVDELACFEKDVFVVEKNSTSAMFADSFIPAIDEMKAVDEIVIIGCCTDICVMNLAIPLQNYFDQKERNVRIIVPKNAVETYDAPYHNKDEYNNMAFKFMAQAGIKVVNNY